MKGDGETLQKVETVMGEVCSKQVGVFEGD